MTDRLKQIWQTEEASDGFTSPDQLGERSTAFEKRIRRRNLIEYAAGALIAVIAAPAAVMFLTEGMIGMAVSMVLTLIGTAVVLWNLHARASAEKRHPEEDCRSHLVAQYRRQADALRKVPLWYIGPLLPGVLGVYGTVAFKTLGKVDASEILIEIGRPLGITLVFFAFVIWINLRAARWLERKVEALEEA